MQQSNGKQHLSDRKKEFSIWQIDRIGIRHFRMDSIWQYWTTLAGCQCKKETKSHSLTWAMHGILIIFFKIQYLARKLFANSYNRSNNKFAYDKQVEIWARWNWKELEISGNIISRSQAAFSKFGWFLRVLFFLCNECCMIAIQHFNSRLTIWTLIQCMKYE